MKEEERPKGRARTPRANLRAGEDAIPVSSQPRTTRPSSAGCLDHRYCRRTSYSLQLPQSILQLPLQLHDFTWKLLVPKDRLSLALVPAQKLQQHTHERVCNTSFSYLVASAVPGQDLYFGSFCSGGSIEQIQVKENISVTLRTFAPNFQQESSKQDLTVSFIPHFKGKGVFHSLPLSMPRSLSCWRTHFAFVIDLIVDLKRKGYLSGCSFCKVRNPNPDFTIRLVRTIPGVRNKSLTSLSDNRR